MLVRSLFGCIRLKVLSEDIRETWQNYHKMFSMVSMTDFTFSALRMSTFLFGDFSGYFLFKLNEVVKLVSKWIIHHGSSHVLQQQYFIDSINRAYHSKITSLGRARLSQDAWVRGLPKNLNMSLNELDNISNKGHVHWIHLSTSHATMSY